MTTCFADSFYFLAILNTSDEHHESAALATPPPDCRVVTTEFVLIKVADALSHPRTRGALCNFVKYLRRQPNVEIVPATGELFESGLQLFADRPDKRWSLTDCISFHVMQDRGMRDALTGDHHFAQAGFNALIR